MFARRLSVGAVHPAGDHHGGEAVHQHHRGDADALLTEVVGRHTSHRQEEEVHAQNRGGDLFVVAVENISNYLYVFQNKKPHAVGEGFQAGGLWEYGTVSRVPGDG